MNIAIVEDERDCSDLLLGFLARFKEKAKDFSYEAEVFASGEAFLSSPKRFSLLFLDIELTGMNGLEMARKLRKRDKDIVILFVTSLGQYAINGYEVDALDFCLKPLEYPDFEMKMGKVLRHLQREDHQKIHLHTVDNAQVVFEANDLYYVEVIKHYLIFHTREGDYRVRGTMHDLEAKFYSPCFFRTNSGYLVNMKYVTEVRGDELTLNGQTVLTISRSRKNAFLSAFASFLGGMR